MAINDIFDRLNRLTHEDGVKEYTSALVNNLTNSESFKLLKIFYTKIFKEIDDLSTAIRKDDSILISVKHQKLLRSCFQLITSLNVLPSLLPGLGVDISKRCPSATTVPTLALSDEQKYEMLVDCADFFTRCYEVSVLKNIIITLHLVDYLAMLIQLSFAPFKKPGVYTDYTMTQVKYDALSSDRQKYLQVYKHLVTHCFQPTLMKELLVLQSVINPSPPAFVKRVVAKEMSQRLMAPGGLLSLIRCFIESFNVDSGCEWRKIDVISKIVSTKHGSGTEEQYLQNICSQIIQIVSLNNTHYLATAAACALSLHEKYPQVECITILIKEIFQSFNTEILNQKASLPGTIVLSSQEVEHKINILFASVCACKIDCPFSLLRPNLFVLFLLGVNCTKNEDLKIKLKDTILKCLEQGNKDDVQLLMTQFLFGQNLDLKIDIEEYDAGLAIKCKSSTTVYPKEEALLYFLSLFMVATDSTFIEGVFEVSLQMLIDLNIKRLNKPKKDLLGLENDMEILDNIDEEYVIVLQLLSEISTCPKVISSLKSNPGIVLNFIEHFIRNTKQNSSEECTAISLVLLNTILSNSDKTNNFAHKIHDLVPILKTMSEEESSYNSILCKEALCLLTSKDKHKSDTEFGKAIRDMFDELMPVQAHGIIALTKLIDARDPETISKKYYVFCLLQEHLKNPDSYMYLSAVNGIAALGAHCTEDVLFVLCKEFLQMSIEDGLQSKDDQNKIAELRMKIGDIIVKVTKRLGDMAIVHKTILLNTMLCGCRDADPLIRTSALSNLAEIALVLHYRIGTIIYEVLHCIWSILETDNAIECRRASVMVIASLIKGLDRELLVGLKDNLLPVYRTLKALYRDPDEDSVLRLHAQLALEELNDIVNDFMFPEVKIEKQIFVLDKPQDIFK
ncbi:transport and Golgi organization protein 6 homolog [Plodia interpunctella]|uniref:transport and Golgi organization protein 6 homolog n=1 Tax=Plodia interpunctella TaxID=58824 RepID=UPI002367E3AC|nr:transport and Golgi organization protein 6 homolog [Plodia interpunctella]